MVSKDTLIGIVGAVILVAAMAGVFWYEGANAGGAGSQRFDVQWSTATMDGPTVEGETQEGESTDETVELTTANITEVSFTLSWSDDVGDPDTFRITVTSPDGSLMNSTEGDSGEIRVAFPGVNDLPPEKTVLADSEEDARAQLADQHTKTLGQGEWQVTIELVEAGDFDPTGQGPPLQEDTGNSWELTTRVTAYEPDVTPS